METEIGHRPDHHDRRLGLHRLRPMLEERAVVLERLAHVCGLVGAAQPAPRDQVGTGGDRRRGVELQQRQPVGHLQQLRRSISVEQLRPHRDATGFVA